MDRWKVEDSGMGESAMLCLTPIYGVITEVTGIDAEDEQIEKAVR